MSGNLPPGVRQSDIDRELEGAPEELDDIAVLYDRLDELLGKEAPTPSDLAEIERLEAELEEARMQQ
jgi:hypothetical protein